MMTGRVFTDEAAAAASCGDGEVVYRATRDGREYFVVDEDVSAARAALSRYCGDVFELTNAADLLARISSLSEDEAEALLNRFCA